MFIYYTYMHTIHIYIYIYIERERGGSWLRGRKRHAEVRLQARFAGRSKTPERGYRVGMLAIYY